MSILKIGILVAVVVAVLPTDREHVRTLNLCEGYPAALRRRIDRLWQAEDELEGRLPRPLVGVGTPRRRRLCHTPR